MFDACGALRAEQARPQASLPVSVDHQPTAGLSALAQSQTDMLRQDEAA